MSARGQAMIGMITTAVFLGVGVMMWLEQRPMIAALLLGLGLLRGVAALRQARAAYGPGPEED